MIVKEFRFTVRSPDMSNQASEKKYASIAKTY